MATECYLTSCPSVLSDICQNPHSDKNNMTVQAVTHRHLSTLTDWPLYSNRVQRSIVFYSLYVSVYSRCRDKTRHTFPSRNNVLLHAYACFLLPFCLNSLSGCLCFFFWMRPVLVSPDSVRFLPFHASHWLKEAEDKQLRRQQLQIGQWRRLAAVTTFTILVLPAADVFQDISRFEGSKLFWNINTAETARLIRTFLVRF